MVVDVGSGDPIDPMDVGNGDPLDVGSGDPLDVGNGDPLGVGSGVTVDMFTTVKYTPGVAVVDSPRTNHELEVSNVLLSQRCRERRTDRLVQVEQREKH